MRERHKAGLGSLIVPVHVEIQRLEKAIADEGVHLKELQVGDLMYEGLRCYGVSFVHGRKPDGKPAKWELTVRTNYPDIKTLNEAKIHLLEVVLRDIRDRFTRANVDQVWR